METFPFVYHGVEVVYPSSGTSIQLGGGYTFTAPPVAPDERTFKLSFPVMKFFVDPTTGSLDLTTNLPLNMGALEAFYNRHKRHKTFLYPLDGYGNIPVKFSKPLEMPKALANGNGATGNFSIELVEDVNGY